MKTIELLAPAGSPEALDAAVGEGADAVYLGLKDFNARLRSTNFTYAQFEGALRSLHRMGKKVYVTVNTVFEQREADRMYQLLKYLADQGPDAIIVQDFGVAALCKSEFPSLKIHASTQMNIASARGANALSRHGVSRVVLARELSLEEIQSIKTETNLELEVFVHGALCISVSGICLFSSFLGGKSANRGMCTQACRRLYHQTDKSEGEGYYFSPNDLQLLERLPDLANAGVKALKIEGRMKSASYVGAVVSAYRLVADAIMGGDGGDIYRSIEMGQEILRNDFARPKTQYLFKGIENISHTEARRHRGHGEEKKEGGEEYFSNGIDWLNPQQDGGTGLRLGTIQKLKGTGDDRCALVFPPRGLVPSARDSVRIHHSDDSGRASHKLIFSEKAPSGGYWISVPQESSLGDYVYLIQTKEMRKRYAPVITQVGASKGPGREKAPFPQIQKAEKKDNAFPEGLYVAVSRPEDLFIVQSSRPQAVILELSRKNAKYLLSDNKSPLPFKPAEIILSLDPWFPQDISDIVYDEVNRLYEKGYNKYIVNNPGHFSLFKGLEKTKIIAGPYLYIFNSWALSFVSSSAGAGRNIDGFVSPLENNRQNLILSLDPRSKNSRSKESEVKSLKGEKYGFKRQYEKKRLNTGILHSRFFITVFAWPPLFNIRTNLRPVLDFNKFADNRNENFTLVTGNEGSRVFPDKHFSITDKIPFLKEAGFGRFIIDLCGTALKKSEYRDLMRSINENAPLPNSSRFNWKDGFFSG